MRYLVDYLAGNDERVVTTGREWCRQILVEHDITFPRTKTAKESTDPDRVTRLHRAERNPDNGVAVTVHSRLRAGAQEV